MALFHVGQHAKAIQLRHDDVQQHQVQTAQILADEGQGLHAVRGLQNVIPVLQQFREHHPVHAGVVYDENVGLGLCLQFNTHAVITFSLYGRYGGQDHGQGNGPSG